MYNDTMSNSADIVIIGGGVIGLTTATFAARNGVSIAVLDRGELGREASWAGAGIIPPGNPSRVTSQYDILRALSSSMYPQFSEQLREETGIDNGYRRCGGIEWLFPGDEELPREWAKEGISFERLSACKISYLEPEIGVPDGIPFHFPDMAQVRNPWHVRALIAMCEKRGIALRSHQPVEGFERQGDRITAVQLKNGERWQAGQFVIAAGAWSDLLLDMVGVKLGVHPVRGQMVLYHTPAPLFRSVLLHGKRYLVPREDGRTLVGSTEEPEVGFHKANTSSAIDQLKSFAASMVPSLASAEVETSWAGLRPGSVDGLPFIGRLSGFENLFVSAGHFRAGIQLSIASGLGLSELLLNLPSTVPLEPFRPDRSPATFRASFRS